MHTTDEGGAVFNEMVHLDQPPLLIVAAVVFPCRFIIPEDGLTRHVWLLLCISPSMKERVTTGSSCVMSNCWAAGEGRRTTMEQVLADYVVQS